jgi:uncharacterized iron-regulated membrane protein
MAGAISIRRGIGLLHRWVGLALAGFLCVSGLTGAVIAWNEELDLLLNPHLLQATGSGPTMPATILAQQLEARDPRLRVTYFPVRPAVGRSQYFFVAPRIDPASGRPFDLTYDQVFIDPFTGDELGRRARNAVWPITRETAVAFIYRLHQHLHVSGLWGVERLGLWVTGAVALCWSLHCVTGAWLTLPARRWRWRYWKPAWQIKLSGDAYRVIFDIHRAFGLWAWLFLFTLAFSGFSLNLYREMFHPLLAAVSQVTPTPYEQRRPQPKAMPIEPAVSYADIHTAAVAEGERRGWSVPPGALLYAADFGIYQVRYFHPGHERGAPGLGAARLYFDAADGRLLGERVPGVGTVADIVIQAQFPVHSGRILGLPGRILVSVMGLVTAVLSVAGVLIWSRKRAAAATAQS